MAQSVERIHGKDEVAGPIPARSSNKTPRKKRGVILYNKSVL